MMRRRQDHIIIENIWFVWSKTFSKSGEKWRCHHAGPTEQANAMEWKLDG